MRIEDSHRLKNKLERLTEKMTDMKMGQEEQCSSGGLPEGAEGTNAAGFLRVNLSKGFLP